MEKTLLLNAEEVCYTSLALGRLYNQHALQLAKDIALFSPKIPFVALTDRPHLYKNLNGVLAIKHTPQSVGIYHDKLFCIKESLSRFNTCIFLDADCRLLGDFAQSRQWKPGITAKSCCSLQKHLTRNSKPQTVKAYELACQVAQFYRLNLEDARFVIEIAFIVSHIEDSISVFIQTWEEIRDTFESQGIFNGEGMAIALAALRSQLPIYHYDSDYSHTIPERIILYKDKLYGSSKVDSLSSEDKKLILTLENDQQKIIRVFKPNWLNRGINKLEKIVFSLSKKIRFLKLKAKQIQQF